MASIKLNVRWEVLKLIQSACERKDNSNYVERLARQGRFSYGFVRKTVLGLEEDGIITRVRIKKRKYLFLTEKGHEILKNYSQLDHLIKGDQEEEL